MGKDLAIKQEEIVSFHHAKWLLMSIFNELKKTQQCEKLDVPV